MRVLDILSGDGGLQSAERPVALFVASESARAHNRSEIYGLDRILYGEVSYNAFLSVALISCWLS